MARNTTMASPTVKCPVCGSRVEEVDLGRAGLTIEQLNILRKHIKEATFGSLLQIADAVMKRLEPDKMGQELSSKEMILEVRKVQKDLTEILGKIAGPAIGKIGEEITIKDLKTACPQDEFSEENSSKQGTDIVATVIEDKRPTGTIAISVKYDNTWKREFIRQLEKNMKQEGTPFGILVTKSFPKEALNDKVWLKETTTGVMLVAKPEYASVVYCGYRLATIAWNEAKKNIKDAESRIRERDRIFNAVVEWINGKEFNAVLDNLHDAYELSEATDKVAKSLRRYTEQQVKQMLKNQEDLREKLMQAEMAVQKLKELLNTSNGDGKKPSPKSISLKLLT